MSLALVVPTAFVSEAGSIRATLMLRIFAVLCRLPAYRAIL